MRAVTLTLFGPLREGVGASSVVLQVPTLCTVREVLCALTAAHPLAASASVLSRCVVAVDDEYTELDALLPAPGGRSPVIAVIPPVSGG